MVKSKARLLIANNQILGYSHDKKAIDGFIKDYNLKDYRIEKVKEIPVDIEYEFQDKEIYFDAHYDTHVSVHILTEVSIIADGITEALSHVDTSLLDALHYFKLDPNERALINELRDHLSCLLGDLGNSAEDGDGRYYDDYFDTKALINQLIQMNIVIHGGEK